MSAITVQHVRAAAKGKVNESNLASVLARWVRGSISGWTGRTVSPRICAAHA